MNNIIYCHVEKLTMNIQTDRVTYRGATLLKNSLDLIVSFHRKYCENVRTGSSLNPFLSIYIYISISVSSYLSIYLVSWPATGRASGRRATTWPGTTTSNPQTQGNTINIRLKMPALIFLS